MQFSCQFFVPDVTVSRETVSPETVDTTTYILYIEVERLRLSNYCSHYFIEVERLSLNITQQEAHYMCDHGIRKMNAYLATGIAEGFEDAQCEEEAIAAWQYLHDSGLAYTMQGWFGRQAQALLATGIIHDTQEI